jgi:Spy/CpxP family protein refolding chaperone
MNPTPFISVLLFGAISVLSTVATTQAQTPPPALNPALNPESRLEAMRARLGLSEEQVAKLKPVVAEESSKLEAIKEDATLSDSQKKEKAGVLMASFREKLGAVLNAEQRAQLAEETQRRGAQGLDEMVQRLQAMKDKLGLSDEQIAKIRPVLMEEGPKLKALKDDKTTSPEEKRVTLKQSMERIAAELTPEQKEKMREQLQKRAAQSGEESPKK